MKPGTEYELSPDTQPICGRVILEPLQIPVLIRRKRKFFVMFSTTYLVLIHMPMVRILVMKKPNYSSFLRLSMGCERADEGMMVLSIYILYLSAF